MSCLPQRELRSTNSAFFALPSVLLIFTFASFLPQIRQLWLRRDSSGISLYYVLFNLMVATQILTIDLAVLMGVEESDVFVTKPISAGDWLNLAQFGVVWALWALVYVLSFIQPSIILSHH